MRRRALLAVILVSLFVSVERVAFAEPTPEDHERARTLLAEGRTKRAQNDLTGALESFRGAHRIENLSTTGLEVGKTLIALGRLVEARDALVTVARTPAQPGEPPPIAAARADAHALADSLERRIPTLAVKVTGRIDPSVSATVDGIQVAVDLLGQPRRVDPGAHVVVVHAGGLDRLVDVTLGEGEAKEISVAVPGSDVTTPPSPAPPLSPAPTPSLPPPASSSHALTWIGGGLAVAGLTVGSITGLSAIAKTNELEPVCPADRCPPEHHDALGTAKTMALVSTISFAVAGAGIALVVWDLLRSPSNGAPRTARRPPALDLRF